MKFPKRIRKALPSFFSGLVAFLMLFNSFSPALINAQELFEGEDSQTSEEEKPENTPEQTEFDENTSEDEKAPEEEAGGEKTDENPDLLPEASLELEGNQLMLAVADGTPPTVQITSHTDGALVGNTSSITITGEVYDDNLSHYWFTIINSSKSTVGGFGTKNDSGPAVSFSYDWNIAGLPDGEYTIKLEARDLSGNKNPNCSPCSSDPNVSGDSIDWVTVTIDNTAPAIPTGLQREAKSDGTIYQCGDYALPQTLYPMWNANTELDFDHYEYTSFHPDGSKGIVQQNMGKNTKFIHSWVPTEEGTHGFAVRAVDILGNASDWAVSAETLEGSCQINYDKTGPEAPVITFPIEGDAFNSQPILNDWTDAKDPAGIDHYRVEYVYDDGHTFSNAPYRTTTISERNHVPATSEEGGVSFRVQAFDKLGNEGAWSAWVHYYYDLTKPITTLLSPTDNSSFAKYIPISGNSSDLIGVAKTNLYYKINGSSDDWTLITEILNPTETGYYEWSYDWTPADGVYDIKASSVDKAGNVENSAYAYNIKLDTIPAVITWINPTDLAFYNHGVMLNVNTNETMNNLRFMWKLKSDTEWKTLVNLTNQDTNYTFPFMPVFDGVYELRAQGRDLLLNWSKAEDIEITIDRTDPEGTIDTPTDGSKLNNTITISGTAFDKLSGVDKVQVRLRNHPENTYRTAWMDATLDASNNYTLDFDTTTIPDDVYEVVVVVFDKAGNFKWLWPRPVITIDNTAPVTTFLTDFSGETYYNGDILIEGSSTDPSGIDVVYIYTKKSSDADWPTEPTFTLFHSEQTETYNWDSWWGPEEAGSYDIKAVAQDVLGNLENSCTEESVIVTVLDVVPTVSITANPNTSVQVGTAVTLTASVTGGNTPYASTTWSGSCTGSGNSFTLPSSAGTYNCTYTVTDADGDIASASTTVTVTAPTITTTVTTTGTTTGQTGTTGGGTGNAGGTTEEETGEVEGEATTLEEEEESGVVLGEMVCDSTSNLSGYVYLDKNKNGKKDEDENGAEGVELIIYYYPDGERTELTRVKTNADGKWETDLCPGNYEVELSEDSLAKGISVLGESIKNLSMKETEDSELNFELKEVSFLIKYWWVILLLIAFIIAGGVILKKRSEK